MKILALTKYGDLGASSRVRILQYLPFLQKHGLQVEVFSLLDNDYIEDLYRGEKTSIFRIIKFYFSRLLTLLTIGNYDLVWLQNECFPYLPANIELFFLRKKIPYIVDYDDAIFHNYDQSNNWVVRKWLPKKIDTIMKFAQCVVAGNKYIADRAVLAGASNVVILPTVVDMEKYKIEPKKDDNRFVIGWIGTPKTSHFLDIIKEPLKKFAHNKSDVVLYLIGVKDYYLEGVSTICIPWTEETEVTLINKMDVGIMPLLSGDWEKGKCGYKLIQCMACGKPVIATPIGVNREIVECGVNGFLAEDSDAWVKYFTILYADKELRGNMGHIARKKIEDSYSVQSTITQLEKIIKGAVDTNYNVAGI